MNKRIKLACWNCDKIFPLTIDVEDEPRIVKECLYCGESCVIDFNPFRSSEIEILKGSAIDLKTEALTLPEIIPTSAPALED